MNVDGILRTKGATVITIRPDATIGQLVNGLRNGFDHPEPPEIDRDIPAIDTSIPTRPGL